MKNILWVLISILLISCEKSTDPRTVKTFEVEYNVGSSWVGYDYSVHIGNDGLMKVTETHLLNNFYKENTYNLTNQEVEKIREALENLTTVKLSSVYGFGVNAPLDLPTTKVSYKTSFKADSTSIYFPEKNELPKELELFLEITTNIISGKVNK